MSNLVRTGRFFFEWRDKLPVPLVLAMPFVAKPSRRGWVMGLICIFAGQFLRLWSIMHIGPTTRARKVCADKLVTSGPYSYCRNPLYLGNILQVTGFCLIVGNIKFMILAMMFYLMEFCCIIPYEESFLEKKFEKEFKLYKMTVPAIFPDFSRVKNSEQKTDFTFRQSCRSESKTFCSTLAILMLMLLSTLIKRENRI